MKIKGNLKVSGTTEGITFTDGTSTYSRKPRLSFSSNFYLSGSSDPNGSPVLNWRNPFSKMIVVEFPGSAENIVIFRATESVRLVQARAVLVGSASPSVTVSIQSGSDRSTLGTTHISATAVTNTTTGALLPITTAVVAAGTWICLVTTAQSGTVNELDLNLQFEYV